MERTRGCLHLLRPLITRTARINGKKVRSACKRELAKIKDGDTREPGPRAPRSELPEFSGPAGRLQRERPRIGDPPGDATIHPLRQTFRRGNCSQRQLQRKDDRGTEPAIGRAAAISALTTENIGEKSATDAVLIRLACSLLATFYSLLYGRVDHRQFDPIHNS